MATSATPSMRAARVPRAANAMSAEWPPSVVPLPRAVAGLRGTMAMPRELIERSDGTGAHAAALLFAHAMRPFGIVVRVDDPHAVGAVDVRISDAARLPKLGSEGYELGIGHDGVELRANGPAGDFYGVQTLVQLASTDGVRPRDLHYALIVDRPQFRWRGLHLDVSRHFFAVPVIERYIAVAARFKLNVFHWHLTDDQGWRLQIPALPRLTQVGACRRSGELGPGGCASYSERDVRAVVRFAALRHVMVVPEIEGPGHSASALAAYESLACFPGPYATIARRGSTLAAMCPTRATFAFYDTVFRELAKLFPSPYVHIGGDEVQHAAWRNSTVIDNLMSRERLTTYDDVQGYFTRNLERLAKRYHRRIIGWDEILRAPVSSDAVVMVWTGTSAAHTAIRRGNDVVLSPDPPLYFDAYQGAPGREPAAWGGTTTLADVYAFDALDALAQSRNGPHVLGAQANVWSEYIATPQHLWYMVYPRALALAERCWTPTSQTTFDDFERRAGIALQALEPQGVTFRIPEPSITRTPSGAVEISDAVPNAQLWYRISSDVATSLHRYHAPFRLARSAQVTAFAKLDGYTTSLPAALEVR